MSKLLNQCNKVKDVLSANRETTFTVENLYDNTDFYSFIKRETFEQKSKHLLDQL